MKRYGKYLSFIILCYFLLSFFLIIKEFLSSVSFHHDLSNSKYSRAIFSNFYTISMVLVLASILPRLLNLILDLLRVRAFSNVSYPWYLRSQLIFWFSYNATIQLIISNFFNPCTSGLQVKSCEIYLTYTFMSIPTQFFGLISSLLCFLFIEADCPGRKPIGRISAPKIQSVFIIEIFFFISLVFYTIEGVFDTENKSFYVFAAVCSIIAIFLVLRFCFQMLYVLHTNKSTNGKFLAHSHLSDYWFTIGLLVFTILHVSLVAYIFRNYGTEIEGNSISVSLVNYLQATFIYFLGVVTDQKNLFLLNQREEKLANRLNMIRYVSHEMRTPLNTSLMGVELVAKCLAPIKSTVLRYVKENAAVNNSNSTRCKKVHESLEEMSQNLTLVSESCKVSLSTLDDLLTFDKLDEKRLEIDMEDTNPLGFLHGVIKPLELNAKQSDVCLYLSLSPSMRIFDHGWRDAQEKRITPIFDSKPEKEEDEEKEEKEGVEILSNVLPLSKANFVSAFFQSQKVLSLFPNNLSSKNSKSIESQADNPNMPKDQCFKFKFQSEKEDFIKLGKYIIRIDPFKLSQVIRNLISNAIKFTNVGGNVHVFIEVTEDLDKVGKLKNRKHEKSKSHQSSFLSDSTDYSFSIPESNCSKRFLMIKVTDSGAGISPENQKKLFGQYVQFDSKRLQQGKGSGLGLWISKRIVELHGGSISAHSRGEGYGSTFTVKLPVFSEYSVAKIQSNASEDKNFCTGFKANELYRVINSKINRAPSRLRILIVDDADLNRKVMRKLLEQKGIEVLEASNGKECIGIVMKHRVSISKSFNGWISPIGKRRNKTAPTKDVELFDMESHTEMSESSTMSTSNDSRFPLREKPRSVIHPSFSNNLPYTIDVILIDDQMPQMCGPEAIEVLRNMEPKFEGLIFGVTGNYFESDVQRFMSRGADGVFPKPFDINQFINLLKVNTETSN